MPYIRRCLTRAFAGSVLFTDKLSIVAAPLLSASYFVATGRPMDEIVGAYVAMAVIVLVAGVVFLRLITAPYFIWKEDQAEINSLRAEIQSFERRAKLANEGKLIQDRLDLLAFVLDYRIKNDVFNEDGDRISDHKEFFGPASHILAVDPTVEPLLSELEEWHSKMLNALRDMEAGNRQTEERYDLNLLVEAYHGARKNLQNYLLFRG